MNFQIMITRMTGMEISNASLLDEASCAAESMLFMWNCLGSGKKLNTVFVSNKCFSNTIDSIKTHAEYLGVNVVVGDHNDVTSILKHKDKLFGVIVQGPDNDGVITDYSELIKTIKEETDGKAMFAIGVDIASLMLFKSPGEMGADVAFGLSQRFGVPMGYGGPHAAY